MKRINYLVFVIVLTILSIRTISGQPGKMKIYKGITIYIDYPDEPALVTPDQLDSLINGVNYKEKGVDRTFMTYWYEQSRRNIIFKHDIFFYRAPETAAYYRTLTWQQGIEMWRDAFEWIIANYPDYDWNSLSLVDESIDRSPKGGLLSVMVISSAWRPGGVGAGHSPLWTLSNGVKVNSIYCSVLKAPWDVANNMFMTLHESAHGVFGFPDTYDTDKEVGSNGTGVYSLMSGGKPDVEPVGAPLLAQYNWIMKVEPARGKHTITLRADGDSVVVYRNPHEAKELFTIEARTRRAVGNSLFHADLGLLIWHSDDRVATSNRLRDMTQGKHYRHSIEQADGLFQMENKKNRGDSGDIYISGKNFTDASVPDSRWWDGNSSGFSVTNIRLLDNYHISFDITVPKPPVRLPEIPKSAWKLIYSDSFESGHEPTYAFDGNLDTYWRSKSGTVDTIQHEIQFDLGKRYSISEVRFIVRTDQKKETVSNYEIYLSANGENWGRPVSKESFMDSRNEQYSLIPNISGRYLRLLVLAETNNKPVASISEIKIFGK